MLPSATSRTNDRPALRCAAVPYTVPADGVDETIYGKANRDFDINVPAGADGHIEWTRCVFNNDADMIF